jgi:hypothetical protein
VPVADPGRQGAGRDVAEDLADPEQGQQQSGNPDGGTEMPARCCAG